MPRLFIGWFLTKICKTKLQGHVTDMKSICVFKSGKNWRPWQFLRYVTKYYKGIWVGQNMISISVFEQKVIFMSFFMSYFDDWKFGMCFLQWQVGYFIVVFYLVKTAFSLLIHQITYNHFMRNRLWRLELTTISFVFKSKRQRRISDHFVKTNEIPNNQ